MRSRGAGGGRQPMSSGADGSEAGPGPLPAPEPEKGRDPPSKQAPQQEVAAAEALAPLPAVTIVISRPEEEVQVTEPKGVTPHSPKTANVKAREASVSVTAAAVNIVISRPGEEVQVTEPKGVTPQPPKTADVKAREASVSVTVAAAAKEVELARTDSFDDYEQCRVCQEKTEEPLVHLGCQCRGDLAKAHRTCIDVWFRTRGSNKCEICQQVAVNIPPPETQASGWFSPLWVAFAILICGLLLDVLISISHGVSALPVNIIIGVLIVLGLGTALRLALECCQEWGSRRSPTSNMPRLENIPPTGYHPAVV